VRTLVRDTGEYFIANEMSDWTRSWRPSDSLICFSYGLSTYRSTSEWNELMDRYTLMRDTGKCVSTYEIQDKNLANELLWMSLKVRAKRQVIIHEDVSPSLISISNGNIFYQPVWMEDTYKEQLRVDKSNPRLIDRHPWKSKELLLSLYAFLFIPAPTVQLKLRRYGLSTSY